MNKNKKNYILILNDYKKLNLKIKKCLINKFASKEKSGRSYAIKELKHKKKIF